MFLKKIANREKISQRPVFLSLVGLKYLPRKGKKRAKKLLWFPSDYSLGTSVPAGDLCRILEEIVGHSLI